jgi:hypothetical protein
MNALFTLQSAKDYLKVLLAMLCLIFVVFPDFAGAAQTAGQNQPLVFEVKDPKTLQNKTYLSFEEVISNDPLTLKLEAYLKKHNSPLAQYADKIPQNPQWQRALAISWVESNFGRRCADNNCSGIGVAPGHPSWRKYETKYTWFQDMCKLMERDIYKNKYTTFRKMKGIYVYPGSEGWVRGAEQKYGELMALTKEAIEERQMLAQNSSGQVLGASTID